MTHDIHRYVHYHWVLDYQSTYCIINTNFARYFTYHLNTPLNGKVTPTNYPRSFLSPPKKRKKKKRNEPIKAAKSFASRPDESPKEKQKPWGVTGGVRNKWVRVAGKRERTNLVRNERGREREREKLGWWNARKWNVTRKVRLFLITFPPVPVR